MTILHWFDAALHEVIEGPNGPVARDLYRRGTQVANQAKQNTSGRPGPNVDTGRLRSSIAVEVGIEDGNVVVYVGTNVYYGAILELYTFPNGAHYPWLVPALSALN